MNDDANSQSSKAKFYNETFETTPRRKFFPAVGGEKGWWGWLRPRVLGVLRSPDCLRLVDGGEGVLGKGWMGGAITAQKFLLLLFFQKKSKEKNML